jgi:hypothetical protein
MVNKLFSGNIIPKRNITYNSSKKDTFYITINTDDENYEEQLKTIRDLLRNNFRGSYTYEKEE